MTQAGPPSAAGFRTLPWLLLVAGLACAAFFAGGTPGSLPWEILVVVAAAASVPRIQALILAALDAIRQPGPRNARAAAAAIGALASGYLLFTAVHQSRGFYLRFHDEGSYLIQMHMLAVGRLFMPPHPMAPFFESFQLLAEPVYASVYFPGTALLYVPTVWLHWPYWAAPILASGAIVGLVYLIVTELVDGAAGALAALMMLSLPMFRAISIMVLSQTPLLLLGLSMLWAWLEWRRTGRRSWALGLGVFAGWAAITRPLDAVCFAAPIAAAMLFGDFRGRPRAEIAAVIRTIVLGAAPFLALQGAFNVGVTGSVFTTPFRFYADRDNPQTSLGFEAYDPAQRPASSLPQKQAYYDSFTARQIRLRQPDRLAADFLERRLPWTLGFGLPQMLLAALILPGLLGFADRRRLVMFAPLPLFLLAYALYGFFLSHYTIVVAPALILCVILGARVLEASWPQQSRAVATACTLAMLVTCLPAWPEINPGASDAFYPTPSLRLIAAKLPERVKAPAVVLFTFTPGDNPHEEPVYNPDVAWPDDAPIIRAHDLGKRDLELVRYYAERQPDRMFYLYNRSGNVLLTLGRAADLAGRGRRGPASPSP